MAELDAPNTELSAPVVLPGNRVVRELSGVLVAAILIGVIATLTWGYLIGLWTDKSETERARYVGLIGIGLTITLGVVFWTQNGGRPGRIEVRSGPASVVIEANPNGSDPDKPD